MPDWISHEPALWLAVLQAAVVLAAAFGLPITPQQKEAVLGLGGAILAIVTGVAIRQNVVPVSKIAAVPLAARALKDAGQ